MSSVIIEHCRVQTAECRRKFNDRSIFALQMPFQGSSLTAALATAGVVGGAYCAYYIYRVFQKPKLPTEWTQVGTLQDIYAYPIKSCGPIILTKAECTILGLRDGWLRDRTLMVVDGKNNFITARGYPDLLLIQTTVRNSVLTVKHVDMEAMSVNLAEIVASEKPISAKVWGVTVLVYDCGGDASEWFSRLLDRSPNNYRLVYYASENCRMFRPNTNKYYKFTKNDTGAFPDEVPFHLINLASVEELNTRLNECRVTPRIFRPNFVLAGAKPYDEDNWKYLKIGEIIFEIIKPCVRCIMTTIDPETGLRNAKAEPLETLKSYRQIEDPVERRAAGSAPKMGVQMALRSDPGEIAINDPVYIA